MVIFLLLDMFFSLKIKFGWRWRNLFLHALIFYICIIYIYFYILRRFLLNGLRLLLDGCRKVKADRRILIAQTRLPLRRFIEIISIAAAALNKITFVNELQKLVAVSGRCHSNRLTDSGGRQRQCVSVPIGRKIKVQHKRVCAQITCRRLPMLIFDAEEVRRGVFAVNGDNSLIGYSIRHGVTPPNGQERALDRQFP